MRKLFKILTFTIIVMVISFVFINTKAVNAENYRDLHSKTKIYESSNEDYYIGCEDYEDYEYSNPAITVLTHGLGGQFYHWSNDFSIKEGEELFYNEHSIIKKIYDRLNDNFYLYYVQAGYIEEFADGRETEHSEGLWFYRVNLNDYITGKPCNDTLKEVDHISADKHIVILFDSKITGSTNE